MGFSFLFKAFSAILEQTYYIVTREKGYRLILVWEMTLKVPLRMVACLSLDNLTSAIKFYFFGLFGMIRALILTSIDYPD